MPDSPLNSNDSNNDVSSAYIGPQKRQVSDGLQWIASGFELVKQDILLWVITVVLGFLLVLAINMLPYVGPIAATLLNYVWVGGFMLGCHAVHQGRKFNIRCLFAGFSTHFLKLVQLSAIAGLISMVVFAITLGPTLTDLEAIAASTGGQLSHTDLEAAGSKIIFQLLIAMVIMLPLFMATWYAPALIVFHQMTTLQALRTSFIACTQNTMPFLVYGLILFVMYIVAFIPMFMGLLIVVPIIIASIYTSYRNVFLSEKPDDARYLEA